MKSLRTGDVGGQLREASEWVQGEGSRRHSRQRFIHIILTALYLHENFTLDRVFNVNFKKHCNLLEKLILKKLPCFKFIFALYIIEEYYLLYVSYLS